MPGIATLRANSNATIDATITAISAVRDVTTSRGPSQVATRAPQSAARLAAPEERRRWRQYYYYYTQ